MTRLVGLSGFPHHGKTTASEYLRDHCGYKMVAFAEPLKNMMLQLEGVTHAHVYGDLKNEPIPELGGATARWSMETLGTTWGRDLIHKDLWIIQAQAKLNRLLRQDNVVIEDVRFHNEVDLIHSLGGIVIRVFRPKGPTPNMELPANKYIVDLKVDDCLYNNFVDTDDCSWKSHFYSAIGFMVDNTFTKKGIK